METERKWRHKTGFRKSNSVLEVMRCNWIEFSWESQYLIERESDQYQWGDLFSLESERPVYYVQRDVSEGEREDARNATGSYGANSQSLVPGNTNSAGGRRNRSEPKRDYKKTADNLREE